jgi:TolB protein
MLVFLSCLLLCGSAFAQRFRIVVGGPNFKPYPVAVPRVAIDRSSSDPSGLSLSGYLTTYIRENVEIVRSLELVNPKSYLESDGTPKPNFANWGSIGASGLLRTRVWTDGKNARLAFKFFDVATGRELLSRHYNETFEGSEIAARRFLDELVELLTGEPGIHSSKIAYAKRMKGGKAIFTCDIDGRNPHMLTDPAVLSLIPTWDIRGQFVFFTSYLKGNPDLYRLNLKSMELNQFSSRRGINTGATVSPDGKKIALTLSVDGNTEIYVVDFDGSNLKRLTDSFGQDVSASWSPDGKRIAFVSSRSGNPHIYIMNGDGSGTRRLTFQGTYNQEPDWSPRTDGQIAFTGRDEKLQYDLFLVHPETADITRLTQNEGSNDSPTFSPDGQSIAFTSTRDLSRQKRIFVMDLDGSHVQNISRDPGEYETPTWSRRLGY